MSNILILNKYDIKNPKFGGGTIYVHNIAKHLVELGNNVEFLSTKFPNCKKNEVIDGVKIVRRGSLIFLPIIGFLHLFLQRNKLDFILEVIDVIPWLVPMYSKNKVVVFIHQTQNQPNLEPNMKLALDEEVGFIKKTILLTFEKFALRYYKRTPFITVSNAIKSNLIKLGIPEELIRIIPMGISKQTYNGNNQKAPNPQIIYIGRLKKYKGVQYLIRAVSDVIKICSNCQFLIIGDGEYRCELEKLVKQLGLESHIRFLGYVSEDDKLKLIKSSWFLTIPSLSEGWCIPVIECGMLGVPSIGINEGGLRDSIVNGKTGLLVPSSNSDELANAIIKLIQNRELLDMLGNNAKEYASQFSWENQIKRFEMALKEFNAI